MAEYLIGTAPAWTNRGNPTRADVTVDAQIDADGELHMVGEARRKRASDCDQAGQMQDTIRKWVEAGELDYAPSWDADRVRRMLDTWDRWHLNHLRAGCEHQRALGWASYDEHPSEPCPVCGYKYGTAWLREDLPPDVAEEIGAGWIKEVPA